jgi:hypothetical protein
MEMDAPPQPREALSRWRQASAGNRRWVYLETYALGCWCIALIGSGAIVIHGDQSVLLFDRIAVGTEAKISRYPAAGSPASVRLQPVRRAGSLAQLEPQLRSKAVFFHEYGLHSPDRCRHRLGPSPSADNPPTRQLRCLRLSPAWPDYPKMSGVWPSLRPTRADLRWRMIRCLRFLGMGAVMPYPDLCLPVRT